MASKVFNALVVAASIACILAESPVQIDERHLQQPAEQEQAVGKGWQDSVPGLPGRDYPNLTSIPRTSFSCVGKTPGGYYADVETRCQVFHVCNTQGSKSSFLCPSGSVFNQRHFVCDWWYDFVCEHAVELYSLNDGLDDPQYKTTDKQPPNPPLEYNSLAGSDLSLASSGYANNIRDEANIVYDDYSSIRQHDPVPVTSTEKASTASSIQYGVVSSTTVSGTPPTDNYFDGRRRDPPRGFSGPEPSYQQQQRYLGSSSTAAATSARTAPVTSPRTTPATSPRTAPAASPARSTAAAATSPARSTAAPTRAPDTVPRGFSKQRGGEQKPIKAQAFDGNDRRSGNFVNSGLSNELGRIEKKYPLPKENNNYIDDRNYNNYNHNIYNNDKNIYRKTNNISNNYNNYNIQNDVSNVDHSRSINSNNNRYENYRKNSENSSPLPQENHIHQDNNEYLKENFNNNEHSDNYYYIKEYINANNQPKNNNRGAKYEAHYQKSQTADPKRSSSFDYQNNDYDLGLETTTASERILNSKPSEDEVDRERQREVDSVDLKRERPAQFLIRAESSTTWRQELPAIGRSSTSGSISSIPDVLPYSPDRVRSTASLSRPEEPTTPIFKQTSRSPHQQARFLGRRPQGGLASTTGNGLPGSNKVLAGSDDVVAATGKPVGGNPSSKGVSGNLASEWTEVKRSHAQRQNGNGDGNAFNAARKYSDKGGQSWNDGGRY